MTRHLTARSVALVALMSCFEAEGTKLTMEQITQTGIKLDGGQTTADRNANPFLTPVPAGEDKLAVIQHLVCLLKCKDANGHFTLQDPHVLLVELLTQNKVADLAGLTNLGKCICDMMGPIATLCVLRCVSLCFPVTCS